jgi:hypothetical protein
MVSAFHLSERGFDSSNMQLSGYNFTSIYMPEEYFQLISYWFSVGLVLSDPGTTVKALLGVLSLQTKSMPFPIFK